jgi:hypothetical protein
MSISIVNGYVCTSSCDVAKAKKGQDPHPAEGLEASEKAGSGGQIGGATRDRAVVLGGSLADLAHPSAVKPVGAVDGTATSNTSSVTNLVDILV